MVIESPGLQVRSLELDSYLASVCRMTTNPANGLSLAIIEGVLE